MRTYTRTHTYVAYANPYLRCASCGEWVTGWHDPEKCGCRSAACNMPCRCRLGVVDVCPSWSPVDGCGCPPDAHDRPPVQTLMCAGGECVTQGMPDA